MGLAGGGVVEVEPVESGKILVKVIRKIKIYLEAFWLGFKESTSFRVDAYLEIFSLTLVSAGLGLLWYWLLKGAGAEEIKQSIGYLLVSNGTKELVDGRYLKFSGRLMESIKEGDLSASLLRPIKPYRLSYFLFNGSRSINHMFGLSLVVAGIVINGASSWINLGGYIICVGIAYGLAYFLNVIIGSLAFWMTTASSVRTMIHHIINILSGSLVPIDLFPKIIGGMASVLPFASLAYLPATVIRRGITENTIWLMGVGVAWIFILKIVCDYTWVKGLKKYEAVGI